MTSFKFNHDSLMFNDVIASSDVKIGFVTHNFIFSPPDVVASLNKPFCLPNDVLASLNESFCLPVREGHATRTSRMHFQEHFHWAKIVIREAFPKLLF